MADYHQSLSAAVFHFPLAAALALWPAAAQRRGLRLSGPTPTERAIIRARRRCRQFLRTHFDIITETPPERP